MALKLDCEVLLLGFGPITHAFAKRLSAQGHKVIAVSQRPLTRIAGAEFPLDSFHTLSWEDVLSRQISSTSTYIGWRQSPQSQPLGVELIDWVRSANLRTGKIHHLSSASVYTGNQEFFSERDYDSAKTNKSSNSKQILEKLVVDISREKDSKFINYRISNVYGSGLGQGFINESLSKLRNREPITIYKELDLIRDYILIDDLISGLMDLRLNESSRKVLNLSTGRGVSISEIIAHLKDLGVNDLKLLELAAPKNIVTRSVLSCKKLEEVILWKPQGFEEILHKLVDDLI
jgi:nucleoside-diphosphate-sugar epimerase